MFKRTQKLITIQYDILKKKEELIDNSRSPDLHLKLKFPDHRPHRQNSI